MRPLTHRRILAISVPIVLSNAAIPLLGAVDTGVVGQLGTPQPIGGVGLGATILGMLYFIFNFLRMGTTGLVAQSHGAGREVESGRHLARALAIGIGIGLALILLHRPLFGLALGIAPGSPAVEGLAREYLEIRIWGAPAMIGLFAINGWLIGVERTGAVLALQLVLTAVNIVLDLWFVLGIGWGVPGVAAATLVAEYSGFAVGLWLARRPLAAALRTTGLFERPAMTRLLRVNADLMVRSLLLQLTFSSFTFLGAGQGDVVLAANQVLMQFLMLTAYALDGFCFSAETLVGQSIGARRPARVRQAALMTSLWAVGGAVLLGVFYITAGAALIDLLAVSPTVRQAAREYLVWAALAPVLGVASWVFDGIFTGATLTREMRLSMTASVMVYVPALAVLPQTWGNHGLWAALMVMFVARGVTMALYYPRVERAAGAFA
ncbi:MATE family efflux transporter [Paracoccus sp. S-4012]|nr:MATE family efflux transporter [Paracoccus sp. S-4012]MRX49530.1 MATE family efflux transporter [Paracoccus sp. S-4012]